MSSNNDALTPSVRLGRLLKTLRANAGLTQEQIGKLLGDEAAPLSTSTISLWETATEGRTPPTARLDALARLFSRAETASPVGVRLPEADELTRQERSRYEDLRREFLRLREQAASATAGTRATSLFRFPDHAPVTIVCPELPADEARSAYADPKHPDYVRAFRWGDVDSVLTLYGEICRQNPDADVDFKPTNEVSVDDLSDHVVAVGGVAWNEISRLFMNEVELPVEQVRGEGGQPDLLYWHGVSKKGDTKNGGGEALPADAGVFARCHNPRRPGRLLTICTGVHTRGVLGAALCFSGTGLGRRNTEQALKWFGAEPEWGVVFTVSTFRGLALRPSLGTEGVMLQRWPPMRHPPADRQDDYEEDDALASA